MKYKIKIKDKYVEVSEQVYKEYMRMERRERYLQERDLKHGVVSYHALERYGICGEEFLLDTQLNIEDKLVKMEENNLLYKALSSLEKEERDFIGELYFYGKKEGEMAMQLGIRQQSVHSRKKRILKKLKKFMENFKMTGC